MDANNSKFLKQVDYITGIVGDSILYTLGNFGKSALPIVSGMLFAVGVFDVFLLLTANTMLAFIIAGLSALGLESTGLNASKRAIKKPSIFTISIFIGYIILGGGSLWFTDLNTSFKVITSTAFLLTGINYLLYGLVEKDRSEANSADINENKEMNIEQRDYDRTQEEKQVRFENKLRVEKLRVFGGKKTKGVAPTARKVTQTKTVNYRKLTIEDKVRLKGKTVKELQELYPTITPRTARNWVRNLKENR